jgi:hypothetical protein
MNEPLSKETQNEEAILKITQATTEDYKTTAKESNEYDQYEKIYLQHMEEITKLEQRQQVSKILTLIGLIIFFIMLAIKVQINTKSYYFSYLLIPAFLTVISMTVMANSYLLLKEVFDNAHKMVREEKSEGCSLGTILSLICLNMTSVCVLLYLLFLAIKLDNPDYLINVTFNLISIPIYVSMGITVFFFIFILPALIFHGFYFAIIVISSYITCFVISFLMLNLKLDKGLESNTYVNILTAMMVAIFIHILYFLTRITLEKDDNSKGILLNIVKFFGMAGIFASTVLIALRADGKSPIPNCIPLIILGISLLMVSEYCWGNKEDEESSYNIEEKHSV